MSKPGPAAIERQVERAKLILASPTPNLSSDQLRALRMRRDYPNLNTSQLARELGVTVVLLHNRLSSAYRAWQRAGGEAA